MFRIIKYIATAIVSAAAIYVIVKTAGAAYNAGMNDYTAKINADVEAKRAELVSSGVFHEGVTVNGIPIGGMTYDEARNALREFEKSMVADVGFELKYGDDQTLEIGRDYFTIGYNTDEILSEAIMLASDGELEAIRQQIDDLAAHGKNYEIEYVVKIDADRVIEEVTAIGESLKKSPKNASCKPNPDSVYNGGDRFTYKAGRNGYEPKTEEAIEEILSRAEAGDYGTVVLEGNIIEPDIKLSDLQGKIVKRSSYRTSFASGQYAAPNRVFNIIKASGLVNGTVLPPKSSSNPDDKRYVFSANSTLGDRTEALGWLPAPGFVNGGARSEDSPGGGVCQVSSTLYNAVIRADLQIVYRINHSSHVGYVPWGLDATIDTGRIDFKFANNTKNYIYIFMWVNEAKQTVNCEIWGDPFPSTFDKIDFYAELVEETPPSPTVYIPDSSLTAPYWFVDNEAKTGYKYQSYKQYYKNGEPVGDPIRVASSEYRMHPKRIHVWPGFNPDYDILYPYYKIDPYAEEEP
ncbi:MAG: VanW family protein [Clostridia bacterium]|nr:VanW family protein [Clostridia bacterium]